MEVDPVSALPDLALTTREPETRLTLLDLVHAVNEVADDEDEAVALIMRLLQSGRVRLTGHFRECHLSAPPRRIRR